MMNQESLNKKQLYELRKQEKLEAKEVEQKERKKNQLLVVLAVGIPVIIAIALIAYAIYVSSGAGVPDIGEHFPNQGQTHIQEGEEHPLYNSNPPTSGWHYATPAPWGVYNESSGLKEELPQERLVHNLEHGGIVIQYKPGLDPDSIAKLEDLKESEFECKLVVAPYSDMEHMIALTAWQRLYTSDEYDEETIKNFIRKYRDRGPELVPCEASVDHTGR